jgi:predicted nucleic acid-binding protein
MREEFWLTAIRRLGRRLLFLDTGAILNTFTPGELEFTNFLDGIIGDKLVTSSFVVAETIRRLVKTDVHRFVGPGGERHTQLAVYFLHRWLQEKNVAVLAVPEIIFDLARRVYAERAYIGCDLTDVLSLVIVQGLEHNRIVSPDRTHFSRLGLMCLP